MKVTLLSTFKSYGGAATCARRLLTALDKHGVQVNLVYLLESKKKFGKSSAIRPWFGKASFWFLFALERFLIYISLSNKKDVFQFSTGRGSFEMLNHPAVREADVIHLHWVSFGFLSINEVARLAKAKPLIWTLHDMWPFTGGCHYSYECMNYTNNCNECFYLSGFKLVSASSILRQKVESWDDVDFSVIGSSKWITDLASQSKVFQAKNCLTIGTSIDVDVFKPYDSHNSASILNILFGAVEVEDKRKGFEFFKATINLLNRNNSVPFKVTILGSFDPQMVKEFDCEVELTGRIEATNELVKVFNEADVFVLSSIEDNLPNIVMESMACGTPVVAFDSGGVSDLVIHKETGYLAEKKNVEDLANGIRFLRNLDDRSAASQKGRQHIIRNFSESVIAEKHVQCYEKLLAKHTSIQKK